MERISPRCSAVPSQCSCLFNQSGSRLAYYKRLGIASWPALLSFASVLNPKCETGTFPTSLKPYCHAQCIVL